MAQPLRPVSRADLIRRLTQLGFDGPTQRTRHAFMSRGEAQIPIPNSHGSEISVGLLRRLLRDANVTREEWLGE